MLYDDPHQNSGVSPQQQNSQANHSETNPNIYHIELTLPQATFLSKLLPAAYSFQLEPKLAKRASVANKTVKEDPKPALETKKKSSKVLYLPFRMTKRATPINSLLELKGLLAIK